MQHTVMAAQNKKDAAISIIIEENIMWQNQGRRKIHNQTDDCSASTHEGAKMFITQGATGKTLP